MPGYIIAQYRITDEERIGQYVDAVMPILQQYGGQPLVVDGASQPKEGEPPHQTVVVRFPSVEKARAFYDSEQYRAVRHLRTDHSDNGSLVIVEGVAGPD